MNPERQRIAIAQIMGITATACGGIGYYGLTGKDGSAIGGHYKTAEAAFFNESPDYLNDLNAMHEAEKGLTSQQVQDYARLLLIVLRKNDGKFYTVAGSFANIHATAAHRAEAFLRNLDKWEETA